MSSLKYLPAIILIFLMLLVQIALFAANQTFLVYLDLFTVMVIFLSFIDSRWSWWLVILGGWLLDLYQGTMGVNLLTFMFINLLINFLRSYISTTGRLKQFISLSVISLVAGFFFAHFSQWLILKIFNGLGDFNLLRYSLHFSFWELFSGLLVNLLFLVFLYFIYLRNKEYLSVKR